MKGDQQSSLDKKTLFVFQDIFGMNGDSKYFLYAMDKMTMCLQNAYAKALIHKVMVFDVGVF